MTNPPKEKDTLKEAANELEEVLTNLLVDLDNFPEDVKQSYETARQSILSLIESEKVKAVADYKKRLVEKLAEDRRNFEGNLAAFEWRRYLRELIKLVEETE